VRYGRTIHGRPCMSGVPDLSQGRSMASVTDEGGRMPAPMVLSELICSI
jgi:hypothetical protein